MEPTSPVAARVRKIDWLKVLEQCEIHNVVHVGIADQSIRTHIRKGRVKYIDPEKYDIWTERVSGSRTQAHIYMRKKPA